MIYNMVSALEELYIRFYALWSFSKISLNKEIILKRGHVPIRGETKV